MLYNNLNFTVNRKNVNSYNSHLHTFIMRMNLTVNCVPGFARIWILCASENIIYFLQSIFYPLALALSLLRLLQWLSIDVDEHNGFCVDAQNRSIDDIRIFFVVVCAHALTLSGCISRYRRQPNFFSIQLIFLFFLLNQLKNKYFFHTLGFLTIAQFSCCLFFWIVHSNVFFYSSKKNCWFFFVQTGFYTRRFNKLVLRVELLNLFFLRFASV